MSLISQHNRKAETLQIQNTELLLKCEKLEKELATLRAKAAAYDKGVQMWGVYGKYEKFLVTAVTEWQAKRKAETWFACQWDEIAKQGGTCRKVRVCEVVE